MPKHRKWQKDDYYRELVDLTARAVGVDIELRHSKGGRVIRVGIGLGVGGLPLGQWLPRGETELTAYLAGLRTGAEVAALEKEG